MTTKVFFGGLPTHCSEDDLIALLNEQLKVTASKIVIKKECAFLDFALLKEAEDVVEKLHGYSYDSSHTLVVRIASGFDNSLNDIVPTTVTLSDVPNEVDSVAIRELSEQFGEVLGIEKGVTSSSSSMSSTCSTATNNGVATNLFTVTFASQAIADKAAKMLNGTELGGNKIVAFCHPPVGDNDYCEQKNVTAGGVSGKGGRPISNHRSSNSHMSMPNIEFPLRMLVQSEMVGAIIGRSGQTIREITQQTRARVDVHRKDNLGGLEKAITVYGQPENCTNACRLILNVMMDEAKGTGKSADIPLKILAHNSLVGRIIGKQGMTIKKIMDDTDTKITVSSISDISSFNMERIILIKGSLENLSRAEAEVSAKLRAAYESDIHAITPQNRMFAGIHQALFMSSAHGNAYSGHSSHSGLNRGGILRPAGHLLPQGHPHQHHPNTHHMGFNGSMGINDVHMSGMPHHHPPFVPPPMGLHGRPPFILRPPGGTIPMHPQTETVYMYIPNASVGAIIGTKGNHIRNLIKYSGTIVKIAQADEEENNGTSNRDASNVVSAHSERKVTVSGPPEAQWKAQFLIYEKLKEEGFGVGFEDVRLTVEILVPSCQVGRIIGRGGANVRELQRVTGSIIKLPEQASTKGDETPVHIIGTFYNNQSAQRRLRAMVNSSSQIGSFPPRQLNGAPPPVSGHYVDPPGSV